MVVKEVPKSIACSKRMEQQKSLQLISHNFVLRHLGLFEDADQVTSMFDYCPRGDLVQLVESLGSVTEMSCQFYVTEITLAVSHLHSHCILHCDLKPSNVLLDADGHVQVADFSIINADAVLPEHGFKAVLGSPEFLAPEILSSTDLCRGTDWYSVGALTCYMLSGKAPFEAADGSNMLQNIMAGKLTLDKSMSLRARNFITATMRLEADARLGANDGGGDDVLTHMLFAGVSATAIASRQVLPPHASEHSEDEAGTTLCDALSVASSASTRASCKDLAQMEGKTTAFPSASTKPARPLAQQSAPTLQVVAVPRAPLRAPKRHGAVAVGIRCGVFSPRM